MSANDEKALSGTEVVYAGWERHKYAQGTMEGIAFARGARWWSERQAQQPQCHKRANDYCMCSRKAMLCDGFGLAQQPQAETRCELGCATECKAKQHGCASECPALPWQPQAGPSGDTPEDFSEGQWWLKELDAMAQDGTPDQKRAVAVVRNLMATAKAQQAEAVPDDVARDAERYRAINTPEIADFLTAVQNEALHQRERWGSDHDEGKTDADWFWLLGYLGGKAMHATTDEKRLHHIITTAAACLNWHAARVGAWASMRPGIDPVAHGVVAQKGEPPVQHLPADDTEGGAI